MSLSLGLLSATDTTLNHELMLLAATSVTHPKLLSTI